MPKLKRASSSLAASRLKKRRRLMITERPQQDSDSDEHDVRQQTRRLRNTELPISTRNEDNKNKQGILQRIDELAKKILKEEMNKQGILHRVDELGWRIRSTAHKSSR